MKHTAAACFSILAFAACGTAETPPAPAQEAPEPAAPVATAEPAGPEAGSLEWALAGDWRTEEERARDAWRNPKETLEFFGLEPGQSVVEIWPGGGWYTKVIAPYLAAGDGTYTAVMFDPEASERAARALERFQETYGGAPERFGEIEYGFLSPESDGFAPEGEADLVLTFRNVHNWMAGGYEAKVFEEAFAALKPGGVLGVVEHRLPSAEEQDPQARNGYVHEDYVKALAAAAGFEFDGASEVNANPADTANHPFGVWTLPPRSFSGSDERPTPDDFDPAAYLAIGESDRMTLRFVKPAA